MGAYANGFKTTTTQWLVGKDAPVLPLDDGELLPADVRPCLLLLPAAAACDGAMYGKSHPVVLAQQ